VANMVEKRSELISEDEALVLTALPHGEHGAVVRFLCRQSGLRAGYVAGARGKRMRATLHPGNRVALRLRVRSEGQLPTASAEVAESRALLAYTPGPAAVLMWLTELTAAVLAEAVPHPRLVDTLDTILAGLSAGMDGSTMRLAVARYELLLLQESGFGLDLESCALGGRADDLAFVSPNSGRAVSRAMAAGQPWAPRLLPLPAALFSGEGSPADAADALRLTGHFLELHWLHQRPALRAIRERAARA